MKIMKNIVIYLQILLLLFSSACSSYKSNNESKQKTSEPDLEIIPSNKLIDTSQETILGDYQIDSSCKNLLLEVVNGRYGMVFPPGKILDIRVIKNGKAEYDFEDSNNILRKEHELSNSQFYHLKKMLDSKEMISSKSVYVADRSCLDAVFERTITFCPSSTGQKKDILIKECRPINSDEGEKIPIQILNVIKYVDKLKK